MVHWIPFAKQARQGSRVEETGSPYVDAGDAEGVDM